MISKRTGAVMTFTPERTKAYEKLVRDCAALAVRRAKWSVRSTPIELEILVHRARRAGDATNFCKSVEDACNGIVWVDDELVRRVVIEVFDGQPPGVTVMVRDIGGDNGDD